jgi:uncharacterized RDD family membrane protein YckC
LGTLRRRLEARGRIAEIWVRPGRAETSRKAGETVKEAAMSETRSRSVTPPERGYGAPLIPRAALEGVRSRRIFAACLDFLLVSILSVIVWVGLFFLSFGVSAFVLPPLFPAVAFFYNGLTVSGWRMATPGMRFMDLEVRLMDGGPAPFLNAAVPAVLFYVSWLLPPVFLVSLVTSDKRCLHDMAADVVVLRRSA